MREPSGRPVSAVVWLGVRPDVSKAPPQRYCGTSPAMPSSARPSSLFRKEGRNHSTRRVELDEATAASNICPPLARLKPLGERLATVPIAANAQCYHHQCHACHRFSLIDFPSPNPPLRSQLEREAIDAPKTHGTLHGSIVHERLNAASASHVVARFELYTSNTVRHGSCRRRHFVSLCQECSLAPHPSQCRASYTCAAQHHNVTN